MRDLKSDFESVTPDLWLTSEETYMDKLLQLPNWSNIPLINSNASHNMPDGSLVRFRGMIQDMHNPEFYFENFEVYNSVTNEVKIKSGKYRDTADILENEKINYTENLKSAQRETFIAVSMPGLNDWAKNIEDEQNRLQNLENLPNTSQRVSESAGSKLKRNYDDSIDDEADAMEIENEGMNKELCTQDKGYATGTVVSREHLLNFPLPDVASKSCIVKLYTEDNDLKLNDMIEVIGFLSVDPILSGEFRPKTDDQIDPQTETEAEIITHNPPPSLVPRLHAVHIKKLTHCNPLVTETVDQAEILKSANNAREHLLKALTELLLGDELAAEYLICHLISRVYHRQDTLAIGQFCLNLSNLPTQKYPDYAKQLYEIIKQFVTKSYYLPMTIENMNTMAFLPKKDYDCNRLTSGVLQLSKHTHLVLDETKLEQGTLDNSGVLNVAALGSLIQNQRVEYDFKYHKMEFDSDVAVLVLSEGRSLLPSDFHVPLLPEESSLKIFDAIVEAATYYLKDDIMNLIRVYLTNIKLVKYTVSENVKFVEDDFITMRSNAPSDKPVTADDLHRLLILARLVGLSRGRDTLSQQCWERAKQMEAERLRRVESRTQANRV